MQCCRPQAAITDPMDQPAYYSNSHQGSISVPHGKYHTAFLTPYVGLPFLSTSPLGTISCHNSGDSCNALNVCGAQMIASVVQTQSMHAKVYEYQNRVHQLIV